MKKKKYAIESLTERCGGLEKQNKIKIIGRVAFVSALSCESWTHTLRMSMTEEKIQEWLKLIQWIQEHINLHQALIP